MTVVQCGIRMAKVFITVIVSDAEMSKQKIKEYDLVCSLDVPMYAIVKEDVNWDSIKHIPWKKVYCAKSPQEVPIFLGMIDNEIGGGLSHTQPA